MKYCRPTSDDKEETIGIKRENESSEVNNIVFCR